MVGSIPGTRWPQTASPELVLRVCGSSRDGQIVRLRSEKCSIGSAAQCTLRLRSRQVRPVHCLIVQGVQGTVVRRWAPDTRLNGRAFADAQLQPGDRLGVGAIELEVLELADRRQSPQDEGTAESPQTERPAPPHEQLPSQAAALLQGQQALAEETRHLQQAAAELKQEEQRLETQRRCWETEQSQREAAVSQHRAQLDAREAQVAAQLAALEQQQHEWEAWRARSEEELSQRVKQADALQAELQSQQAALEQQQQEQRQQEQQQQHWQSPETVAQTGPAEDEAAPGDKAGESELRAKGLLRESKTEAPVDLASILRKIGVEQALTDDEGDETPAEPPASEKRSPAAAPVAPQHDAEEESIDDYMARLMKRHGVSSNRNEPAENRAAGTPAQQAQRPAATADAPEVEGQPSEPSSADRRKPVELAPRTVAPENAVGLSAMRELAQVSARSAIDKHTRQRTIQAKRGKLLLAAAGVVAGGALLWMWHALDGQMLTFYAGVTAFVVALVWGIEYALLAGRLMVHKLGRVKHAPAAAGKQQQAVEADAEATPVQE